MGSSVVIEVHSTFFVYSLLLLTLYYKQYKLVNASLLSLVVGGVQRWNLRQWQILGQEMQTNERAAMSGGGIKKEPDCVPIASSIRH